MAIKFDNDLDLADNFAKSKTADAGEGGTAVVTTDTDLSLTDIPAWEPPEVASLEAQKAQFAKSDALLGEAEGMVAGLRERNQSWLKGEISGDTADRLREQSALGARMGGIAGSQAARNLKASDFGLTSMQIQESGTQREAQLSEMNRGLAGVREQRAQFLTQLNEQSKQFGANISDQMTRTQLAHRELMLKQDAFNAEQNMKLLELITTSTMSFMQLQVQAAGQETDFGGGVSTYQTLQDNIQTMLDRSNLKK